MEPEQRGKLSYESRQYVLVIFVLFCILVMAVVISMNIKGASDSRELLEESIKSQLISISAAAREIIDVDAFASYNDPSDIQGNEAYQKTLANLRSLAINVDAKYIYALKEIDGKFYFIFDTDTETDTSFTEYTLFDVHRQAFEGKNAADIMNVNDQWGSFNTGAVPIMKNGQVVGIVSADIEDVLIARSIESSWMNIVILVSILTIVLGTMCAILVLTASRVRRMQDKLNQLAHFDKLTGLPNRQYLLERLSSITSRKTKSPFALLFIDLNNFSAINATEGHDAGDRILTSLASFLKAAQKNVSAFRLGAGPLSAEAQIGGDEFILLVPDIAHEEAAAVFCEELLDNFRVFAETLKLYSKNCDVSLSVGISLFPYHTENYHVLLKYANIASLNAKAQGKNRFCVYQEDMGQ